MSTSERQLKEAAAQRVRIDDDALTVDLSDGRSIAVPLVWFPRLLHRTTAERANCRLIGTGEGIHWPDLDEDVRIGSLLAGRGSSETGESLRRWMESRKRK